MLPLNSWIFEAEGGRLAPFERLQHGGHPLAGHPRLRLLIDRAMIFDGALGQHRLTHQPLLFKLQPDQPPACQHALAVDTAGEHAAMHVEIGRQIGLEMEGLAVVVADVHPHLLADGHPRDQRVVRS